MSFFNCFTSFNNFFTGGYPFMSGIPFFGGCSNLGFGCMPFLNTGTPDFSGISSGLNLPVFNSFGTNSFIGDYFIPSINLPPITGYTPMPMFDTGMMNWAFDNMTFPSALNTGPVTKKKEGKTTKTTSVKVNAKNLKEYTDKNVARNNSKRTELAKIEFEGTTIDNLLKCAPEVVDAVIELNKLAAKNGCKFVITSSFRSYESQKRLNETQGIYGKGGNSAPAGTSGHEYGQAIDMKVIKNGEQIKISKSNTPWLTDYLASAGMNWGGNWSGKADESHHFDTGKTRTVRRELGCI